MPLLLAAGLAQAQWAGYTVGANAGYAQNQHSGSSTCYTPAGVANGPGCTMAAYGGLDSVNGVFGGAQAGYAYQSGRAVIGVEADYQGADIRGSTVLSSPFSMVGGGTVGPGSTYTAYHKLASFGTARLNLGYAGIDRWLLYATGGFAYGRSEISNSMNFPTLAYPVSTSHTRDGWTLGAGVARKLTQSLSLKLEALYYNLGKETYLAQPIPPLTRYSRAADFTNAGTMFRIGVNYRF
jgi:outer membrane immunogenic protein